MTKLALAKKQPVEYRKQLEASYIIITNLTLPKLEDKNRLEKKSPIKHV